MVLHNVSVNYISLCASKQKNYEYKAWFWKSFSCEVRLT